MNTQTQTPNAITVIDGFVDNDPTQSPLHGTAFRFKDGDYFAFADELNVEGRTFAVFDRREGWQKLAKDCPPEYLMRVPGEPRPPQPHVEKRDWPLNLNNQPEHPWKLTTYLYLLDTSSGEILTFWSNTIGGRVGIGQLSDQVSFMRRHRPNAIPVVALESRDMPTQYGGTKPRPHFKICGWKTSDSTEQRLLTSETPLVDVVKPSIAEEMGEEVPWTEKGDALPDLGAEAAPKNKKK